MSYKKESLDFLGITRWHELGYTGKGIKIMSDEKVSQKKHPDVISPKGYKSTSGHGDDVMSHLKLVAHDATFIAYPMSVNSDGKGGYISDCADYIKNQGITIFTTSSTSGNIDSLKEKSMQDCIDKGCTFFAAAGNDNKKGMRGEVKSEKYLAIGGVKPIYVNGSWDFTKLKKVNYSSVGEELDYTTVAEILDVYGTSFCTPVFAGMCALVQQFFIEKIGRVLLRKELEIFINDNLIDVDEKGFDIKTGNGLFVLPEPSTIDAYKYVADTDVGYLSEGIYYGGFPEVRSDVVMRGIDKLHPELQVCANKFLEECKSRGLDVCITETLRTQEEQEALYAQGRTTSGKIVTNCRGFQSPHCWGVAFDFCRNVKGKEYDNSDKFFDYVGEIAKTIFDDTEYDLFWGGDFKTFVDKPHIEMKKYLPNNSTVWLIDHFGTPEEFMATWYDMKEEGGNYVHRYKTVEEMPEYYRKDIQELIDRKIIAGRGGEAGLDLSDDMCRMAIYAKKIFEGGNK